ncbi:MAG: GTP pyrophosphokinase [Dyella sp.]|uniref:GTP pyrophosphokinase n=1 Tax=Dyella sp. TaxID=1869338 RepID=UPI003F80E228
MNIDDYERQYFPVYEAFAATVQFILKVALAADPQLPQPQSIQSRAKSVESLRKRLDDEGKLDSHTLEQDRRDLAGARIIFYTNNDVDRFLASVLIRDNFEIEEDSLKVHHPTPENDGVRYRGIHYTIRLRDDRLQLPEYARFAELRCEIQIQTILNHAWSETSHDIIYKNRLGDGFGKKAIEGITRRFERIMDKYLIPAGYEIQKAQQDYERVLRGKQLFDSDLVTLLKNAKNNNERYDILSGLKDYAIPHYDDLPAAYASLKGPLLDTVRAARADEVVPIETTFGAMRGMRAEDVTKLAIDIISVLRYQDAVGTLILLFEMYASEPSERIKEEITSVARHLGEYNINIYNQVGPSLQLALIDHIDAMTTAEIDRARSVALAIWSEALKPEITSQTWKADSMILRSGTVPASDQLREVRTKAIHALFAAFDRSTDDDQRRLVLSALEEATRAHGPAERSDALLATSLQDTIRIVEFLTQRATGMSYELRQHLEQARVRDYHWAKHLGEEGSHTQRKLAEELATAILRFRDCINGDERFVRYKVLVGFESVYPVQWDDLNFDFNTSEEYRKTECSRYLDEINAETEEEWFALITRCAETKSNDLATFPTFTDFLVQLAQRKPDVAQRFLNKAGRDLRGFLAAFLNGLFASSQQDIYEKTLAEELDSGDNLPAVARHLRYGNARNPSAARSLLDRSIAIQDSWSVMECLLLAMRHWGTDRVAAPDIYMRDALSYLTERKDARWVYQAWFSAGRESSFYDKVPSGLATQMLENMAYLPKINHQVEQILTQLAKHHLEAVWDYFGERLQHQDRDGDDAKSFEAVPFQLFGLEKALAKDPALALARGLAWFQRDAGLFEFRGGRLLSAAFPRDANDFFVALANLVKTGGETEVKFALAILRNYHGEAFTHSVLKEIVFLFPKNRALHSAVRACIESFGIAHGEHGVADAWRARRNLLDDWLKDSRQAVVAFAEREIATLTRMITDEERRAESDKRLRDMKYDDQPDSDDDNN